MADTPAPTRRATKAKPGQGKRKAKKKPEGQRQEPEAQLETQDTPEPTRARRGAKASAKPKGKARAELPDPDSDPNMGDIRAVLEAVAGASDEAGKAAWKAIKDKRPLLRIVYLYLQSMRGGKKKEIVPMIQAQQALLEGHGLEADVEQLREMKSMLGVSLANAVLGSLEAQGGSYTDLFVPCLQWALCADTLVQDVRPSPPQLVRVDLIIALMAKLLLDESEKATTETIGRIVAGYRCGSKSTISKAQNDIKMLSIKRAMDNLGDYHGAMVAAASYLEEDTFDPHECQLMKALLAEGSMPRIAVAHDSAGERSWLRKAYEWVKTTSAGRWIKAKWEDFGKNYPKSKAVLKMIGQLSATLGSALIKLLKWSIIKLWQLAKWLGPALFRLITWAIKNPRQVIYLMILVAGITAAGYVALFGWQQLVSLVIQTMWAWKTTVLMLLCVAARVLPWQAYGAAAAYGAGKVGAKAIDALEKVTQAARAAKHLAEGSWGSGLWKGLMTVVREGSSTLLSYSAFLGPKAAALGVAGQASVAMGDFWSFMSQFFPQIGIFLSGDIVKDTLTSLCDSAEYTLESLVQHFPSSDLLVSFLETVIFCQEGKSKGITKDRAELRRRLEPYESEEEKSKMSLLKYAQYSVFSIMINCLTDYCSVADDALPAEEEEAGKLAKEEAAATKMSAPASKAARGDAEPQTSGGFKQKIDAEIKEMALRSCATHEAKLETYFKQKLKQAINAYVYYQTTMKDLALPELIDYKKALMRVYAQYTSQPRTIEVDANHIKQIRLLEAEGAQAHASNLSVWIAESQNPEGFSLFLLKIARGQLPNVKMSSANPNLFNGVKEKAVIDLIKSSTEKALEDLDKSMGKRKADTGLYGAVTGAVESIASRALGYFGSLWGGSSGRRTLRGGKSGGTGTGLSRHERRLLEAMF